MKSLTNISQNTSPLLSGSWLYMNVFATDSGENFKASRWGYKCHLFFNGKGTYCFYRRYEIVPRWVVWIRREQAGASPRWGTQDGQGQAKALHPSRRGSHMGGAEQQDRRVASFRDLVEKIPSHPGGQRPEKGLEGQMQFLLIPGPEEVGEVTS